MSVLGPLTCGAVVCAVSRSQTLPSYRRRLGFIHPCPPIACSSWLGHGALCAKLYRGVTPRNHVAGVEADLIIYVTNGMGTCEGDNLASSISCASDTLTNRPVAGSIDYCNFGRHRFQSDLMVSVHEMIHILVRPHSVSVSLCLHRTCMLPMDAPDGLMHRQCRASVCFACSATCIGPPGPHFSGVLESTV